MTLAFNLFFWDDWLGVVTSSSTQDGGSGGGGSKYFTGKRSSRSSLYTRDFRQLDQDFWDQREEYLRTLLREIEPKPRVTEEPDDSDEIEKALARFNEERSTLIIAIRKSPDVATMKAHGKRLNELNASITALLGRKAVAALKR